MELLKFLTIVVGIIIALFLIGNYPFAAMVVAVLGIVFLFLVFYKD